MVAFVLFLFYFEFQWPGAPTRAKEHMTQGKEVQNTGQPPCAPGPAEQGEGNLKRGTCDSRLVSLGA